MDQSFFIQFSLALLLFYLLIVVFSFSLIVALIAITAKIIVLFFRDMESDARVTWWINSVMKWSLWIAGGSFLLMAGFLILFALGIQTSERAFP